MGQEIQISEYRKREAERILRGAPSWSAHVVVSWPFNPCGAQAVRLLPGDTVREKINGLEAHMKGLPKEHRLEIPPVHHFADGLYAREITIPKGTLVVGKVHAGEHLNIVSKGEISVITEDGVRRIKAPCTLVSRPGTKRVGYAHEDTVWTTIHANPENEHDLERLEARLIAIDIDTLPTGEELQKLSEVMG
jgi:hypothetical protein